MTRKERYNAIFEWFALNRPVAQSELHYENPFQLLVAVILSAQCTDKRVNLVTARLFPLYPDAFAMAKLTPEDLKNETRYVMLRQNTGRGAENTPEMRSLFGEISDRVVFMPSLSAIFTKLQSGEGFAVLGDWIMLPPRIHACENTVGFPELYFDLGMAWNEKRRGAAADAVIRCIAEAFQREAQ